MSKSDPNAPYMNLFDPWFLASQLPAAIGHREQTLIEKIQRLEARAKLWKRCAKSWRESHMELVDRQCDDMDQYFSDLGSTLDDED